VLSLRKIGTLLSKMQKALNRLKTEEKKAAAVCGSGEAGILL
jgi:hypothetical protein